MRATNADDVEELAKGIHEAGRRAVVRGLAVIRLPGTPFFEWEQLPEEGREARREMARYLLGHFWIVGSNAEAGRVGPMTAEDVGRLKQFVGLTKLAL